MRGIRWGTHRVYAKNGIGKNKKSRNTELKVSFKRDIERERERERERNETDARENEVNLKRSRRKVLLSSGGFDDR